MDHTTVHYTITNFNEVEKQLDVIYDDGSWAKIQLKSPLPSNQEELEAIIKQFTSPQEVVAARNATTDLSFITPLVNQSIQITRVSNVQTPSNIPTNTPSAQQIKNMEIQQQYALADQLVLLGVLKENPVDLNQIVKDPAASPQPISVGTQTL